MIDNRGVSTETRRFPAFLAPAARAVLAALAERTESGWEPGRQGTGYEKLPLRGALADREATLAPLLVQARVSLGVEPTDWDAYLLRFPEGSHVPPHRDPSSGGRHLRLNTLVRAAAPGTGELRLEGQVFDLAEGDAVRFRSDAVTHQVSRVEGERLVFSVGCVY